MAGTTLRLVPLTRFEWGGLQGGTSSTVVLADYIDLSEWKEGQLIVRLHSGTSFGTGVTAALGLYGIDPAFDDPSQVFDSGLLTTSPLPLGAASPAMDMSALVPPFGVMARLKLTMSQPATPAVGKMWMSCDLVLKTDG